MSSVPFDIIALIIDIVDKNLLKERALVSHAFLQICSKYLFATVELHDAVPDYHLASSKKGFVKYIRKRTYKSDWNTLDSSLTSAFLHLMNLPTTNHIDLSFIKNFPLSSLTPSVNLHRLDIFYLRFEEDSFPDSEIVGQSEMVPKFREFHTSESSMKLLHAKRQDGRPAFNFMDLRRLSISFTCFEEEWNIRYLLQNGVCASTLKVLDLTVSLYDDLSLAGLCEELEGMAGHYILESLSFEVRVDGDETEDSIGSIIHNVEKVSREDSAKLSEALQSLPDKYPSHLSKLESIAFNFSAYVVNLCYNLHILLASCPVYCDALKRNENEQMPGT